MKSRYNANNFNRMENDPEKYKWGIFYFNPADTRILVPKRAKWMGWTLNFANLWSYVIMASIIGCAVLISYLDKLAK